MQHKCFRCGTEFDGNFCPECGQRWQENKTCPKCGATLSGTAKFCNECGYSFVPKPVPATPAAPVSVSAPHLAQDAPKPPTPPKKVLEKPKRPPYYGDIVPIEKRVECMPDMEKHIKFKRTIIGVFLFLEFFINFIVLNITGRLWLRDWIMELILLTCVSIIGVLAFVVTIWSRVSHVKGWHPEKVYSYSKLLIVLIFSLTLLPIFIVILILYCRAKKQRKLLCLTLCGYETPAKNPQLATQYEQDCKNRSALFVEYQRQKEEYKKNRRAWKTYERAWTVYQYQKKRHEDGKAYQNLSYSSAWIYLHRVVLSLASIVLVAVITVTCVLTTRDTRFRVENITKIGLPADEQKVTEVLGKPFEKRSGMWLYFSRNYMSIEEKLDKLMDSDSLEDAFEKSAELEEKLMTLEYQAIIVEFSGTMVQLMMLDAAAVGPSKTLLLAHEKQVKECSILQTSFWVGSEAKTAVYTVSYTDGSYCMGYLPSFRPTEAGQQTIKWSNIWGNYSATITVSK